MEHACRLLDTLQVRSLDDMLANISSKAEVVVDARLAGRFAGTEPEIRAGLRGGHIPGECLPSRAQVCLLCPARSQPCVEHAQRCELLSCLASLHSQSSNRMYGQCYNRLPPGPPHHSFAW